MSRKTAVIETTLKITRILFGMIKNTRIKKTAVMKILCNLYAIFNLALFSQHECLIYVTKRLKIRLIEEFKEWSEKFRCIGVKFKYDDLHSVRLVWSMYGGRYVSLRHDLSKTVKEYKKDYTDVPVPILKASIQYFKNRQKDEDMKKLRRNEKIKEKIGKKDS